MELVELKATPGFLSPSPTVAGAAKTVVVLSRETGNHKRMWWMLATNMIYGARWIRALQLVHNAHLFDRLILVHIKQQGTFLFSYIILTRQLTSTTLGSQHPVPDDPRAITHEKWDPLLSRLEDLPNGTCVHFLVRGWDGDTTAQGGMTAFLRRFTAAPKNLSFEFTYFQRRETTSNRIQLEFGRWWNPPTHLHGLLEDAMQARVHPTYTHNEYDHIQRFFHQRNLQMVQANSTLAMWHVKSWINQGKANGNAAAYNHGRNNMI
jgi:hypothetical protein